MSVGARVLSALRRSPSVAVAVGVAGLSYVLAFIQRPGRTFTDTRIELTLDPARFLHSVTSVWSSTGDLGHVQSGQFVGYLMPLAPWYAFAHAVGLPTWVAERILLGTLLAGAGVGAVVLVRTLLPDAGWISQAVAGLLFVANPYTVVATDLGTAWFPTYAALPWVLVATHRGIRSSRAWRWPAVMGLLFVVANGGVNVSLPFWIVLAVPALLLYEVLVLRSIDWRRAAAFSLRAAACVVIASLWWLIPALAAAQYGTNPLPFTEQPIGILATSSISESLRLLGYWLEYYGNAAGASIAAAGPYLFNPLVILASFLVPLTAIAGFARLRRLSYAPFLIILAGTGVVAMSLGFPPGSRVNQLYLSAYYHSTLLQVLRTTWKAAPLVALPISCLAGLWTESIVRRARSVEGLRIGSERLPAWSLVALIPLPILWALPMFDGTAINASSAYNSVPSYWRAALRDATRATNSNQRILILPGQLFGSYRWGYTGDSSVGPFLTPRRVTVREASRFPDPRSSQLLATIDDLVQQNRLVPGQLEPLLQLLGVGSVLVNSDGNLAGDGALDPADIAGALRDQPQFKTPAQRYGRLRLYTPEPGRDGSPVWLPDIRRYTQPNPSPGVVRVHPLANTTIVDGDASGIAELAAEHMLDPNRALVYAGDTGRSTVSHLVSSGARLVFTDSNQLRIVNASATQSDVGPTLESGDPIAPDTPSYDLFPARGAAGRTIAEYSGLTYLHTPGPHQSFAVFPADAPGAAFDGRADTAWLADPQSPPSDWYIDFALSRPEPVPSIQVEPLDEPSGETTEIGISVNGGSESPVALAKGWNTIPIQAASLHRLRIRIITGLGVGSAGGISGLRIPGLDPHEALRLPTDLAATTRGLDLRHNELTILFARTTADFPYREETPPGTLQPRSPLYARDAESDMHRIVTLPVARLFTVSGWGSVRAAAPDPLLDDLASLPAGWDFGSSDRFEGVPINRASSAFDGDAKTAWVAWVGAGDAHPWLQWSSPHALTIRTMRLTPGAAQYAFPTLVRVTAPGVEPQQAIVAPDGMVYLQHAVHSRVVRLQVIRVRHPNGKAEFLRYLGAVAIAEIRVPGLRPPALRRTGAFATRCGELSATAGSSVVPLLVYGTLAALDQGEPLRLRACGPRHRLPLYAGTNHVYVSAGSIMQPDHIVLDSPPPLPAASPLTAGLGSPGVATQGSQAGVRPQLSQPGWLVLGESYSSGWRAWCRDASGHERALGASVPVDGYANGWLIDPNCESARIAFAAQGGANIAYIVSAIGIVLLIALALPITLPERIRRQMRVPGRRGRASMPPPGTSAAPAVEPSRPLADRPPIRVAPGAALAWGVGVGVLVGFAFEIRVGIVAGELTALFLLVGMSPRRLLWLALLGMVAIPFLYVARPAHNYGGFSFYFSQHQMLAHWIGAGVISALLVAAVLQSRELRDARTPGAGAGKPGPQRISSDESLGEETGSRLGSYV